MHISHISEAYRYRAVRRVLLLAALVSLGVALVWTGRAEGASSGQNGKLVFTSNTDGDEEIYSIDPNGSGVTQLTYNAASDTVARWSPDGQRIAFASDRDGNYEIYVMGADGSNPTRLTFAAGKDLEPVWSPDGRRIAFVSFRDNTGSEIYVMGADGSNPTRLTTNTALDDNPAWSPDGEKIAFVSTGAPYGPDAEIYVMDADGSNPTHLTSNSASDSGPAWSPDGQKIAFASNRDTGVLDDDIYVMAADGSNPTRLATNQGFSVQPTWSPDGQKIAFTGVRADGQKVRLISVDGSAETSLTSGTTTGTESGADWQSLPALEPQLLPPAGAQPSPTSPSATAGAGFPGVRLVSTRLTFGGKSIALKLSCSAGIVGHCSGRTTITARRPRPGRGNDGAVRLGRARFSIAAGQQARVTLRVSRAGRQLLREVRRLRGSAKSAASDDAGHSKTTATKVTIRHRQR